MSAPEESDEEECEFQGLWVVKGNPPGFLDSEDEEVLDSFAVRQAKKVKDALGKDFWRSTAKFMLEQLVYFTEEKLVETEAEMKKYDLLLCILGIQGQGMWEAREEIKELIQKAIWERDDNYGMQDNTDDQIEALKVVNQELREELAKLATGSDSKLQAKLADQTHFTTIMVE